MPRRHNPFNVASVRARDAEYQALWQACDRATRKQEYRSSTVQMRMMILRDALGNLMERRQHGKQMCGTDIDAMIERHLQREIAQQRLPSPSSAAGLAPPAPLRALALAVPTDTDPSLTHALSSSTLHLAAAAAASASGPSPALKPDPEPHTYPSPPRPLDDHRHDLIDEHNINNNSSSSSSSTLFTELAACRADRSQLAHQVHLLEKEVGDMRGMLAVMWNYLHPGMMMMGGQQPQTPDESEGMAEEQSLAMMSQADI